MANTVEYYLSKGFDLPAARYYTGGRRKITGVTANDDFTLTLAFDNGEKRRLDVKRTWFEALLNLHPLYEA